MKKIFSALFVGIALTSSISSCSDASFDEKYADPSKTSKVGVPQTFVSHQ